MKATVTAMIEREVIRVSFMLVFLGISVWDEAHWASISRAQANERTYQLSVFFLKRQARSQVSSFLPDWNSLEKVETWCAEFVFG